LITREEHPESPIIDFLISSSKKDEGDGVFSVNITIIIYESDLHHCLLEYKITFKEESNPDLPGKNRLKCFLSS